jgi:hypothetical protein
MFALAQAGDLTRARSVLAYCEKLWGPDNFEGSTLGSGAAGLENMFSGSRTTDFLESPEVVALRDSIPSFRARTRSRYPWVAGLAGRSQGERGSANSLIGWR